MHGRMNIGDGLTIQSHTVGGKTTSGIYFIPRQLDKRSKTQKGAPRTNHKVSKLQQNTSKEPVQIKNKEKSVNKPTNVKPNKSQSIPGGAESTDIIFINNNATVKDITTQNRKSPVANKPASKHRVKSDKSTDDIVISNPTSNSHPESQKSLKKLRHTSKAANAVSKEIKVDTNFVTLTQDQLNTILNLVKTKQDIDLATTLKTDNTDKKKKPSSEKEIKVEPTSVPGLDLEGEQTTNDSSTESDKENKSKENVENLLEKDDKTNSECKQPRETGSRTSSANKSGTVVETEQLKTKNLSVAELSGTLGGFGSRDREKSRIEERRKKWIEELNEQVEMKKQGHKNARSKVSVKSPAPENPKIKVKKAEEIEPQHKSAPTSAKSSKPQQEDLRSSSSSVVDEIHKALPTAIRSSFFLGEAVPREHAYSAKKKRQQMAWKEELQKQIKEKEDMKNQNSKETTDSNMWLRHFETMNPAPAKQSQAIAQNNEEVTEPIIQESVEEVPSPVQYSPRAGALESLAGVYSGEHTTNATGGRAQSNYLRTMTALLDPSQIDAIELKRQKQLEHRRIIAEQVEEKRRLKEAEVRAKKEEEEQEERRLEEERKKIKNQFEREKKKQHAMEEKRDRQTQELYQQMKEAQATALKEKFERRQQNLKSHGHDTSRLEQTHRTVLEKSLLPLHSPTRDSPVPSLQMNDLHSTSQVHLHHQVTPRFSDGQQQVDQSPISVMASGGTLPIKLEISLNPSQLNNRLVATGVQTEGVSEGHRRKDRRDDTFLGILSDSDADTEYMALPYPSAGHQLKEKTRQKKQRNSDNRDSDERSQHYDRYSRTNQVGSKNVEKPKWGVGNKKKNYVPASDRYINSKRWKQERDERIRRREEQLLNQQAVNHPDRLLPARRVKSDVEISDASTYSNPPLYHHPDNLRRRDRSLSPVKITDAHTTSNKPGKEIRNRSKSPPVPAVRNQLRTERSLERAIKQKNVDTHNRPETAMSVTTDHAKYKASKHSATSPVPNTDEFVEYRRSDEVLDPNQPQSRPTTIGGDHHYQEKADVRQTHGEAENSKDPLINSEMVKQRERQDRILREISILRQGLLLKQREVASYPVAVTMSNMGKNLPERTNDAGQS